MGRVRLRYVQEIVAKGRTYYFFRHRGERIRLPAPSDPKFHAAYRAAHIEALGHPPADDKAPAASFASFASLVDRYLRSPEFKALAPRTRRDYSQILDALREQHGPKSYKGFTKARVTEHIRDPLADTPRRADYAVAVLSAVFKWAIDRELIGENPCKGVKKLYKPGAGYRAWTGAELQRYMAGADSRERLIVHLAFYLAARPQDVAALTWFQIQGDLITVPTKKRGVIMQTDMHPTLVAILASVPRTTGPIIAKPDGGAFDSTGLSQIVKRAVRRIGGLDGCTLHGVRTTALTMAADAGASDHQLMALSTHSQAVTLQRYTRSADKMALASAAVRVLPDIAGTESGKPNGKVANRTDQAKSKDQ
ncbi:MAG: tyrosine-type recombinase/integrase [Pseudomonadota bacterium]